MCKISLYRLETPSISIYIDAYFDNEKLIIEGQDLGKTVDEWWGDSVYEYSVTVRGDEVKKIYSLMQVKEGDKEGLLKAIALKYHTNKCYSEILDFLEKNGIEAEGFSWA